MKKLFGLLLFFIINFSLCAEAPELKNILPNSWEKILKISAKEEIDILQQNVKEIEKIKQHFERYIIFFTP